MAARVCVGGAGAGAEPTPPTLTHSAPQPGRSARCLFFCSAPTTPGSPPIPRVSPTITAAPILRGPPPAAPLPKPGARCLPGPPAGCRGYNGAAEKRDLTFHGGRGGETPSPGPGPPPPFPSPRSPPFREEEGNGAVDGDRLAGGGEPSSPPLARPLRPLPRSRSGVPGRNGASGSLGRDGCGRRPLGLPLPTAPKQ